jgi:hypothetical protein
MMICVSLPMRKMYVPAGKCEILIVNGEWLMVNDSEWTRFPFIEYISIWAGVSTEFIPSEVEGLNDRSSGH